MQTQSRRERLRFVGVEQKRIEGELNLVVELEWSGTSFHGQATGTGSLEGDLRASGQATLAAVEAAIQKKLSVSLVGSKVVRAFDGQVVIASVEVRGNGAPHKVLGTYAAGGIDLPSASALAVLNAINRVVAPLLEPAERDQPSGEPVPTS